MNFQQERERLIKELESDGIKDKKVLEAIRKIPREEFVPDDVKHLAYLNAPQPIGFSQTISQPYTVAFMTSLLDVQPDDKVMEIGTGSGYQAAILSVLAKEVYTLERIEVLYKRAAETLKRLNINNVKVFHRDGYEGLPEYAPYDKIIITAAIPEIPKTLKDQLKVGGYLVAPLGSHTNPFGQVMVRVRKKSEDDFITDSYGFFLFVPMLKGLL